MRTRAIAALLAIAFALGLVAPRALADDATAPTPPPPPADRPPPIAPPPPPPPMIVPLDGPKATTATPPPITPPPPTTTTAPPTTTPPPAAPTPPSTGDTPLPPLPPSQSIPPPPLDGGPKADRAASRNFAGSVQLDYLALPHKDVQPDTAFAGSTVELSLKLAMDFGDHVTANVKVCYACHGFEVGMAYFDLRVADELAFRAGRFSPAFGSFPLRHDPANHATSDKPLPYDMGRMVHFRDWNEGILPAPYVDNGLEVNGSHFFGPAQIDYAAYAISGPKGSADGIDFDYVQSRSGDSYYVDNNGTPTVGGRAALTLDLPELASRRAILTLGGSAMTGTYDPAAKDRFTIAGTDATLQIGRTFLRAEYLARWTHFSLGDDPGAKLKYAPAIGANNVYSTYFFKEGYVVELEQPLSSRVTGILRWDGLRRSGNVLADSLLEARSAVQRYTVATAIRLVSSLSLKLSAERYDFTDFEDEWAFHLGIAGPF